MKLTIEIPDAHAGDMIQFVAALIAKTSPVEATTDPAPGHPELPLMPARALDKKNPPHGFFLVGDYLPLGFTLNEDVLYWHSIDGWVSADRKWLKPQTLGPWAVRVGSSAAKELGVTI